MTVPLMVRVLLFANIVKGMTKHGYHNPEVRSILARKFSINTFISWFRSIKIRNIF